MWRRRRATPVSSGRYLPWRMREPNCWPRPNGAGGLLPPSPIRTRSSASLISPRNARGARPRSPPKAKRAIGEVLLEDLSGLARAREQHRRRRRPRWRDRPSGRGSGSAPEIVPLGQVEQPSPGERVRVLGQITRPLREVLEKLFHDATPATSPKAEFQRAVAIASSDLTQSYSFLRSACALRTSGTKLPGTGTNPWRYSTRSGRHARGAASR